MTEPRLGDDRGAVAAEFAVALPAVLLVLMLGIGALGASAQRVRLEDAVADAARLAARGEATERVHAAVSASVAGASSSVAQRGDLVCVSATAAVLLSLRVTAVGCALAGGL